VLYYFTLAILLAIGVTVLGVSVLGVMVLGSCIQSHIILLCSDVQKISILDQGLNGGGIPTEGGLMEGCSPPVVLY
jgi:hypothetical protein